MLIALLLLVGAGFLVAELVDTEPDEDDLATAVVTDMPTDAPDTDEITDLTTLLTADDPGMLVGREVDVEGLTVASLAGDSTYWAYTDGNDGQRVFVVLRGLGESESGPGTGADGKFNVDDSEVVDLEGIVRALGPDEPEQWGLRGADASMVSGQRVYISARALDT